MGAWVIFLCMNQSYIICEIIIHFLTRMNSVDFFYVWDVVGITCGIWKLSYLFWLQNPPCVEWVFFVEVPEMGHLSCGANQVCMANAYCRAIVGVVTAEIHIQQV